MWVFPQASQQRGILGDPSDWNKCGLCAKKSSKIHKRDQFLVKSISYSKVDHTLAEAENSVAPYRSLECVENNMVDRFHIAHLWEDLGDKYVHCWPSYKFTVATTILRCTACEGEQHCGCCWLILRLNWVKKGGISYSIITDWNTGVFQVVSMWFCCVHKHYYWYTWHTGSCKPTSLLTRPSTVPATKT